MTWLAEWLKEIIFVVLLAAFIDLLLPNRSMERYVKLVVSLLILLTLISPVLRLFSPDAERKLEMAFMDDIDRHGGLKPTAGTEEILRQGEQIRMHRQQDAVQWASEEAAKRMKEQIERETGLPVQAVTVRLEADKKDTEPSISMIEVYMAETEQELSDMGGQVSRSRGDPEQIAVTPVEPVRIEVDARKKEQDADSISVIADNGGFDIEENTDKDIFTSGVSGQIAGMLSRDWGIPKELIHVFMPENAK